MAGIQLNTGNNVSPFWAIFGKVVVVAGAGVVNVQAQLVATVPALVLDISTATIPANGSESISVEGVLSAPAGAGPTCVEIICTSPVAAKAEFARLIAIPVDPAAPLTC
ncbi:MAG TPA: hypothetical protein VIY49_08285 [Bryobacteraceae bacterium]